MSEYSDWLAKQPKEVQKDILGKKADAYQGGTFKPDRFEGAKPITLEQFADKEALINLKGDSNGS